MTKIRSLTLAFFLAAGVAVFSLQHRAYRLGDLFGGKKKQAPGDQPPKNDPKKKKDPFDPLKGLFGQ